MILGVSDVDPSSSSQGSDEEARWQKIKTFYSIFLREKDQFLIIQQTFSLVILSLYMYACNLNAALSTKHA